MNYCSYQRHKCVLVLCHDGYNRVDGTCEILGQHLYMVNCNVIPFQSKLKTTNAHRSSFALVILMHPQRFQHIISCQISMLGTEAETDGDIPYFANRMHWGWWRADVGFGKQQSPEEQHRCSLASVHVQFRFPHMENVNC